MGVKVIDPNNLEVVSPRDKRGSSMDEIPTNVYQNVDRAFGNLRNKQKVNKCLII